MRGINKVVLIGHLGRDPEVKYLDGGQVVAKFPLATSDKYKKKDGELVEHTEWHNVVAWNKMAQVCEKFIKKGSLIYVAGRTRTKTWEDKDKIKRYMTEVMVEELVMLDRKPPVLDPPPMKRVPVEIAEEPANDLP